LEKPNKREDTGEAFGVRTAWQEGGDNDPVNQLAAYHVDLSISSFGGAAFSGRDIKFCS